jgi:DNA-binding FadR family transcriptional regulator
LQTVEPLRLYRQIAGQIETLIDNGEFSAGSRLPAERELATLLGVSRTSVREAIISLEIAGRVEVRVGSGIFVAAHAAAASPRSASTPATDAGPSPFELLAARRLIEGEIAALAARSIRKGELAALEATLARMRIHADDFTHRDDADREFHVLIADASRNGSLSLVVQGLWEQRRGDLWKRIETHFHTAHLRAKALADHAAIINALAAHDADGARAAMHRHLNRVEREFQRQWDVIGPGGPTQMRTRRTSVGARKVPTTTR